jgi:hypothetical protein
VLTLRIARNFWNSNLRSVIVNRASKACINGLSSLVGLLFLLLVLIPTDPAPAQVPSASPTASPGGVTLPTAPTSPTPVDVRTFVTSWYPRGVPYAEAHAYGPQAVPELVAMLEDPSLKPHWTRIVTTLGFIEDASAVQPLMDFMKRQKGAISADAFRGVLSVLPAIGQIAYRGDPAALKIIKDFVDPNAYKSYRIRFAYGRYHDDALGEVLGRMAISALGVSGRPEALALLKGMLNDPALRKDWRDNVTEAIDLNERVSTLGPEKVYQKEH